MKQKAADKRANLLLIAINVICIALIAFLFVTYSAAYKAKLYRQNISSIENLNRSSGTVAQAVFTFQSQKISDIARYVEAENMDLDQALAYLSVMDADTRGRLELVGTEYTGYLPGAGENGTAAPISYEDSSYGELHRLFAAASPERAGRVAYTPEFTDAYSAFKSFAFYTYVRLRSTDGEDCYTLLFVSRSDEMMEKIRQNYGMPEKCLSGEAFSKLLHYDWPGNIRELENVLESAVVLSDTDIIYGEHIHLEGAPVQMTLRERLKEEERKIIQESLQQNRGNRAQTMKDLGLSKTVFYGKLREYSIE